jgi:hypothetical protein
MTALTAFWRNATPEPPPANVAPAPLRLARGISALASLPSSWRCTGPTVLLLAAKSR